MSEINEKKPLSNGITDGVIWKQLMLFFFPILLGTFFQQMYNTADAIIVGKFCGKEALAAVGGTTGVLVNLLVGFFVGVSSGATVIISQYFGARRMKDVSRAIHTTVALALASGALLTVVGVLFSKQMLVLIGTPEDVLDYAVSYLRVYFFGMIPQLIYNIGSGILRAMGDSRRPMIFLICAAVTNIVLDVVLVLGANMGVVGAGIATVISQVISAVLIIITLRNANEAYRLKARSIRFHGDMLAQIVKIGLPAGLQSVMYSVSNIIIQASVNGFGTDVVAAWTAYGKIDGLNWMIVNAFGVAITTFAGQNFGAGQYDRLKKSVRTCLMISAMSVISLSVFVLTAGKLMLGLFADDPVVIETGYRIIRLIAPTYVTYIFIEILSGAMRGAGDTFVPTMMTLTGICLIRLFWVLGVVPKHHDLGVLMVSYPMTWIITGVMFIVYYLRGNWLRRRIRAQQAQ